MRQQCTKSVHIIKMCTYYCLEYACVNVLAWWYKSRSTVLYVVSSRLQSCFTVVGCGIGVTKAILSTVRACPEKQSTPPSGTSGTRRSCRTCTRVAVQQHATIGLPSIRPRRIRRGGPCNDDHLTGLPLRPFNDDHLTERALLWWAAGLV